MKILAVASLMATFKKEGNFRRGGVGVGVGVREVGCGLNCRDHCKHDSCL